MWRWCYIRQFMHSIHYSETWEMWEVVHGWANRHLKAGLWNSKICICFHKAILPLLYGPNRTTSCGPLVNNSVHIKHVKDVGDQEVIDATYQKEVRDKDAELRKDLFLSSEVPSPQQACKCGSECRSNISLGEDFKRVKSMSFIRSPERAWCSCLEVRCTENCLRCLTHTREEEEDHRYGSR